MIRFRRPATVTATIPAAPVTDAAWDAECAAVFGATPEDLHRADEAARAEHAALIALATGDPVLRAAEVPTGWEFLLDGTRCAHPYCETPPAEGGIDCPMHRPTTFDALPLDRV